MQGGVDRLSVFWRHVERTATLAGPLCWLRMGEPISHTTTVMRGSLPSGRTRHDSLNFAVDVRHPTAPEPESIWQVMGRQKDIRLASRAGSHIAR